MLPQKNTTTTLLQIENPQVIFITLRFCAEYLEKMYAIYNVP
jgi:hypothetical protein